MLSLIKHAAGPVIIGLAVGIGASACHGGYSAPSHPYVNASASARAKADAKALARCLPQSPAAQIQLARSLTAKSGRQALAAKCGVPPQNKARFESQLLAAAESGHLATNAGRTAFFAVTLPHVIEENQG